jgi:hypothetical protein
MCYAAELDEICRPFDDKFTIDKFMMFATDCWPSKEAKDVFDHYKVSFLYLSTLTLIVLAHLGAC